MQEAACFPLNVGITCEQCHRGEGKIETKKGHCNHYGVCKVLGALLPQTLCRWRFGSKELVPGPYLGAAFTTQLNLQGLIGETSKGFQ